jgi:hypothetical protein
MAGASVRIFFRPGCHVIPWGRASAPAGVARSLGGVRVVVQGFLMLSYRPVRRPYQPASAIFQPASTILRVRVGIDP